MFSSAAFAIPECSQVGNTLSNDRLLLGYVAEHWGIQWVFGLGIPLVILCLLTVNALGDKPQSDALPVVVPTSQL